MRIKEIEDMLEEDGYEVADDMTDALGYGWKTFFKDDGKSKVIITIGVYESEKKEVKSDEAKS